MLCRNLARPARAAVASHAARGGPYSSGVLSRMGLASPASPGAVPLPLSGPRISFAAPFRMFWWSSGGGGDDDESGKKGEKKEDEDKGKKKPEEEKVEEGTEEIEIPVGEKKVRPRGCACAGGT